MNSLKNEVRKDNFIYKNIKKYLGVNMTKEMLDLYSENQQALLIKVKEDLNQWRESSYSCAGRLNIVKMALVHKAMCRLNVQILLKSPWTFLHK